jgi:hypothetical protein
MLSIVINKNIPKYLIEEIIEMQNNAMLDNI